MKECKRHKWRVGSKEANLIGGELIIFQQNIWCERCDKRIKANIYSDFELEEMNRKYIERKKKYGKTSVSDGGQTYDILYNTYWPRSYCFAFHLGCSSIN